MVFEKYVNFIFKLDIFDNRSSRHILDQLMPCNSLVSLHLQLSILYPFKMVIYCFYSNHVGDRNGYFLSVFKVYCRRLKTIYENASVDENPFMRFPNNENGDF